MRKRLLLSFAFLLSAAALGAQASNPPISPAAAAPQWRSFLGANPLGIPFDIVSLEAETSISSGATIGVVGSYNDISTRYKSLDLRFKYYPGEVALQGFSAGLSIGYTQFSKKLLNQPFGSDSARGTLSAPTLGVLVDYNWGLGPTQRFVVGTGVGAKRVLASAEKRAPTGLERAYLTGRFVIGLLF